MRLCRVKFGFSVETFNQLAEGTSPAEEGGGSKKGGGWLLHALEG